MGDNSADDLEDEEDADTGTDSDETADDQQGDDDKDSADDTDTGKDSDKDDEPADKKPKESKSDDDEPPVRKTKADYIRERIGKKAAKSDDKPKGDDGDDDDDSDDEPDDDKVTAKVKETLEPFLTEQKEREIDTEVDSFLKENEDIAKDIDADKLKRWAKHPTRQHIPVEEIAYGLLGRKLLKVGADKARQADAGARRTKTTGHNGGTPVEKPVSEMNSKEFRDYKEKVLRQRRD